ncbi:MAG: guanine deaminase [Candidatus Cloacimonetes bacterium]|nr:guanine deaminase [Candidatus Cloacimonadota bacterium]
MIQIKTNILTPLIDKSILFKQNQYIKIENSRIIDISSEKFSDTYLDYSNAVCLPGLIDLHVHLSQVNVRGKHADGLLQWLDNYIFTEEEKANDPRYAKDIAVQFFANLLSCGTTTAVVYVAPNPSACDIAFQEAQEAGVRVIMGQTLMDRNCPDFLCRDTNRSLEEAITLYHKWNKTTPLLEYIFTPRFAPVCSSKLMKGIGKFASDNKAYIQTHLSENKQELKWVHELFPDSNSYTEVYEKHQLLGEKTLLGHAIHLSDEEMNILTQTKSKITHCPDSNFFLHSGTFHLQKILDHNIDFALGSDVGAGTTLYMPHIMKMFIYRQEEYHITLKEALYYSTLGAAKVLGKEGLLGSIEKGKEADLTFIELPENLNRMPEEILSYLIYLSDPANIFATYIAGQERYKKKG